MIVLSDIQLKLLESAILYYYNRMVTCCPNAPITREYGQLNSMLHNAKGIVIEEVGSEDVTIPGCYTGGAYNVWCNF